MTNQFLRGVNRSNTVTENGAVSNSTSGSSLVDYFGNAGSYRDRGFDEVSADMSAIFAEDPRLAMAIVLYNRMVTRKVKGPNGTTNVQRGQGARDEFRKSIRWLMTYHPELFYNNIDLVPAVGCWKDLWHEDVIDYIDVNKVAQFVVSNLYCPYNGPLVAKYLPKIKSRSNINRFKTEQKRAKHRKLNAFARKVCQLRGWTDREYRAYKSNGKSHDFQRRMCSGNWDQINFNTVPGKALHILATHKGKDGKTAIERHGIEAKYERWLDTQPVAKFTGYPYELMKGMNIHGLSRVQKKTVDKQFDGLLDLARQDNGGIQGNVWCALDTSGSMSFYPVAGVTPLDICLSLGVYFSTLNEGAFKDHVIMFDDDSRTLQLRGTYTDKLAQIKQQAVAWGSTNFQSVIDEIVRVRKANPNIPVEDYPTTLLVVSDMQFNCTGSNETNYEAAMRKLRNVGLPDITIIWWQVNGQRTRDVPSTIDDEGTVLISGFDGAIVSTLLGGETTVKQADGTVRKLDPYEAMVKALDQEVLHKIRV